MKDRSNLFAVVTTDKATGRKSNLFGCCTYEEACEHIRFMEQEWRRNGALIEADPFGDSLTGTHYDAAVWPQLAAEHVIHGPVEHA